MKNLRNANQPPTGTVDKYLKTSWDIIIEIYNKLGSIEAVADAIANGDLSGFLTVDDIDTIAELNAILQDANLGDFATQAEAEAGLSAVKTMSPLRVAQAVAAFRGGIVNQFNGLAPPTVNDDSGSGYSVNSVWFDESASPVETYRCTDPSPGAAVWVKTSLTADELALVALTGSSDDLVEGIDKLLMTAAERTKLVNIPDTSASQAEMEAGTEAALRLMSPLRVAQAIAALGGTGAGGLVPVFVNTASYAANAGECVFCDSTSTPITVTLPAAPDDVDNIMVLGGPNASTNNVTVARNGKTILGAAADFVIDQDWGDINLGYKSAAGDWWADLNGTPSLVEAQLNVLTSGRKSKTFWMDTHMRPGKTGIPGSEVQVGHTGIQAGFIARAFDDSTNEHMFFNWRVPNNYDEAAGVSAAIIWSPATTNAGNVVFQVIPLGLVEGDPIDVTMSATGNVTDASLVTVGDLQISPEQTASTFGGQLNKNKVVVWRLGRLGTSGSDTMTGDAYIIGVILYWNTDAPTED